MSTSLRAVLVAVLATLLLASTAQAAPTFAVTTTADSPAGMPCTATACSLRSAIAAANVAANRGATIQLPASSAPYTLTSADGGELTLTQPATIVGDGEASTVIHGDGSHGVLEIELSSAGTVALSDLELTGGDWETEGAEGGGIEDNDVNVGEQLDLTQVDVHGNGAAGASPVAGSGADGSFAEGGGIAVTGDTSLAIVASQITGNAAVGGEGASSATGAGGAGGYAGAGGLYFDSQGALTISGSLITGNTATGGPGAAGTTHPGGEGGTAYSGGISETAAGGASITDSTIEGNYAIGGDGGASSSSTGGQGGGGLAGGLWTGGRSTLEGDTISGNHVTGWVPASGGTPAGGDARGGGMVIDGPVTLRDSTIAANVIQSGGYDADASGAGIDVNGGLSSLITIIDSTITDNSADGPSGSGDHGFGGGLAISSPITLASDTIVANRAPSGLGGNLAGTATVHSTGTIVAGGVAGPNSSNCDGTVTDLAPAHNLEDSGQKSQCGFSTAAGDVLVAPGDAGIASALGANGGAAQTLALTTTSPARGAGATCVDPSRTGSPALTADERGAPRTGACDIGAFQAQPPASTGPPRLSAGPVAGQAIGCSNGAFSGDGPFSYSVQWLLDGTAIAGATGSEYVVAAADAGHELACQVSVTGAYGSASATSAAATVGASGHSQPSPPPAQSHLVPRLTRLRQAAARWREARRRASTVVTAKRSVLRAGTAFSFTLDEAATVHLAFEQPVAGRRAGRRCVAITRRNRHGRPCVRRMATRGTLTVSARAGGGRVRFYGELRSGRLLGAGSYQLVARATAGGLQSTAARLRFTIVGTRQ